MISSRLIFFKGSMSGSLNSPLYLCLLHYFVDFVPVNVTSGSTSALWHVSNSLVNVSLKNQRNNNKRSSLKLLLVSITISSVVCFISKGTSWNVMTAKLLPLLLFVTLYEAVLTLESEGKIVWPFQWKLMSSIFPVMQDVWGASKFCVYEWNIKCDNSNESSWAVLSTVMFIIPRRSPDYNLLRY